MKVSVEKKLHSHPDIELVVGETSGFIKTAIATLGIEDKSLEVIYAPRTNRFAGTYNKFTGQMTINIGSNPYSEQRELLLDTSGHEGLHRARHIAKVDRKRSLKIGRKAVEEGYAIHFGSAITRQEHGFAVEYAYGDLSPYLAARYILRSRVRDTFKLAPMLGAYNVPYVVGYNALNLIIEPSQIDPEVYLSSYETTRERLADALPAGAIHA